MMCAMLRLSSKLEYVIKGKEMKSKLQHAAVQEEFLLPNSRPPGKRLDYTHASGAHQGNLDRALMATGSSSDIPLCYCADLNK